MESPSRSRSLRSLALMLLSTLLVLIVLNHLVGRAEADLSPTNSSSVHTAGEMPAHGMMQVPPGSDE